MLRHLRLPSFQPAIAILAMKGSVIDVLHARHVAHVPGEAIDLGHEVVADAHRLLGLDDRGQHVDADGELRGDDVVIAVVARVGPQLRHPGLRIADGRLAPLPPAQQRQQRRGADDRERGPARGDPGEALPQPLRAARWRRSTRAW